MAERKPDPSPEEIQRMVQQIQAGWDEQTERKRRSWTLRSPLEVDRYKVEEDEENRITLRKLEG